MPSGSFTFRLQVRSETVPAARRRNGELMPSGIAWQGALYTSLSARIFTKVSDWFEADDFSIGWTTVNIPRQSRGL